VIAKIAAATAGLLGVGLGLTIPAFLPQPVVDPATVNVVCESFEGPQGPAGADGADGKDGLHSTFTFKHAPELQGLFSEQNVKIETQPIN
tara:strand:+ start:228 stop:497 length:270 start_codon:yes stop_codon:yes gene_type:complete